jgi:hypothetical protein
VLDEIVEERAISSRHRWNPRGIKRKINNFPLRSAKGKKHLKSGIFFLGASLS